MDGVNLCAGGGTQRATRAGGASGSVYLDRWTDTLKSEPSVIDKINHIACIIYRLHACRSWPKAIEEIDEPASIGCWVCPWNTARPRPRLCWTPACSKFDVLPWLCWAPTTYIYTIRIHEQNKINQPDALKISAYDVTRICYLFPVIIIHVCYRTWY